MLFGETKVKQSYLVTPVVVKTVSGLLVTIGTAMLRAKGPLKMVTRVSLELLLYYFVIDFTVELLAHSLLVGKGKEITAVIVEVEVCFVNFLTELLTGVKEDLVLDV